MKRTTLVVLCAAALAVSFASSANASGITAGNIIVNQFGLDGAGSGLSGTSAAVRLKEFTPGGTLVQQIDMPTAAGSGTTPNPLSVSGSATSEGQVTLSGNGQYLTLVGYAAAPGLTSVTTATVSGSPVPRVVGRVTVATGAIDTTTALTNSYIGSNIRSSASTDGTNIWLGGNGGSGQGATGGTQYTTLGATTSSQIQSLNSNMRDVNIFNGQLYCTTASTNLGVCTIGSGLPTGLTNNPTLLPGFNAAASGLGASLSNYDFWFKDASTLYVADDSTQVNNGGIQKWTFDGTKWNNVYTLNQVTPLGGGAAGFTGARGLAGTVDGSGNAVLYATTNQTTTALITVTDTGSGAIASTLAAAPANTAFRGVEVIPVPEPASLILGGLGLIGMIGIYRRRS